MLVLGLCERQGYEKTVLCAYVQGEVYVLSTTDISKMSKYVAGKKSGELLERYTVNNLHTNKRNDTN